MITSVFFGIGIVCITAEEEKELKGTYEEPIIMKLGLSKKFLRPVLCSHKSVLGVGLMEPSTIIDVLKLKLFIGNMRKMKRSEINEMLVKTPSSRSRTKHKARRRS